MLTSNQEQTQGKNTYLQRFEAFTNFHESLIWVISSKDGTPKNINGHLASCNNPSDWTTLPTILKHCNAATLPAICLRQEQQLIFIDLDNVRDPTTESILPWAKSLIDELNSYTEISRSGTGIHIFIHGTPPKLQNERLRHKMNNVQKTDGNIEIYHESKFATITGNALFDQPIRHASDEKVLHFYRKFFPPKEEKASDRNNSPPLSDEKVLKLLRSAANADKFNSLYENGTWDGPDDNSSKDQSLACLIAFYTQDPDQIARLMKASALYREKWEREDYIPRTIETAINGLTNTYQPPKKRQPSDPIPIKTTTSTTGEPFPVEYLPPILRRMAKEVQAVTKTPMELCCSAVLSATSIATRGTVKVYEKENLAHFTCFFFMIIAESGERKSNVLKATLAPIYKYQDEDKERYFEELRVYKARQKTAKQQEKAALNGDKPIEEQARELERIDKELESYKPKPYRYLTDDFTDPALFKLLEENNGSFAVMTLDGGNVLDYIRGKGHGADGSLNDSLLLKATWGDPISRDRIGNTPEGEHLFIKEPACHVTIIVQPDRCRDFLADPRLRGSGLIARVLPVICSTTIGTRFENKDDPSFSDEVTEPYHKLIRGFLERDFITEVRLSKEAAAARREFFNEVEQQMAGGNSLEDLRDIGSKVTTQVTRLAALFQICKCITQEKEEQITENTWYEAEAVGRWFFDQAAHLQRTDYNELVHFTAQKISEKILESNLATNPDKPTFTKRDFQQRFRRDLGKSDEKYFLSDVLETLVAYQWIIPIPEAKNPKYKVNKKEDQ